MHCNSRNTEAEIWAEWRMSPWAFVEESLYTTNTSSTLSNYAVHGGQKSGEEPRRSGSAGDCWPPVHDHFYGRSGTQVVWVRLPALLYRRVVLARLRYRRDCACVARVRQLIQQERGRPQGAAYVSSSSPSSRRLPLGSNESELLIKLHQWNGLSVNHWQVITVVLVNCKSYSEVGPQLFRLNNIKSEETCVGCGERANSGDPVYLQRDARVPHVLADLRNHRRVDLWRQVRQVRWRDERRDAADERCLGAQRVPRAARRRPALRLVQLPHQLRHCTQRLPRALSSGACVLPGLVLYKSKALTNEPSLSHHN